MIVSCPECDARYRLADNAIPPEGRAMRCAGCKHRWFEMGPEPDLEAAVPDVAPAPPPVERVAEPAQPVPLVTTADDEADEDDDTRRGHPVLKSILAVALGLGFMAANAAIWVPDLPERLNLPRIEIAPLDLSRVPWLQAVIDPPPVPPSPLTLRFAVDPQPVAGGRVLYAVTGSLTNPTDEPQSVPRIEGRLIGPGGTVDYRWPIRVPGNALMLPGERFAFDASALGDAGERVVIAH